MDKIQEIDTKKVLNAIKVKNEQRRRREIDVYALGYDGYQFNAIYLDALRRGLIRGGRYQEMKGKMINFTSDVELTPSGERYVQTY